MGWGTLLDVSIILITWWWTRLLESWILVQSKCFWYISLCGAAFSLLPLLDINYCGPKLTSPHACLTRVSSQKQPTLWQFETYMISNPSKATGNGLETLPFWVWGNVQLYVQYPGKMTDLLQLAWGLPLPWWFTKHMIEPWGYFQVLVTSCD